MQSRSGSSRSSAASIARRDRPSALAAEVFDLDDLLVSDDDSEIEMIDAAWLEPVDDTVIELSPEDTASRVVTPSRYPPGLADAEVHAIVGHLTKELCRRVSVGQGRARPRG